ncbi:response regulator [Legionella quateirensis]|uniref:histidine kinase n=1 Tax=Legionella quateirensis TaxID=45072 RepID=A0A378KRK9_9GAMM|nr:response regulator [Legionella quateirensis]KTD52995.1 sensory histidine-kinase / response regulator [Legionella quateirensis]STY17215.1 Aerobic respiration control sensor protein ArcB [Legionella quateirensis]
MKSPKTIADNSDIIELLFNSMPFSYVYWKNTEGVYMGASTNQIKLFDHDGTGFVGKTIYQVLNDQATAKAIDDTDNKIMRTGIPEILEEPVITPQGEKRIFLSQKQPIKNSKNETVGLIGFSLDITDRKKIEEELTLAKEAAEAANKVKTEFLENMRHDIRTPLSGIVGFSEIIKSESTEPKIKEYAVNLVASSHALLNLMDEVLEAVKVSSGEIPMLKRKFNLKRTLEQVVALYQAKAYEKHLKLSLTLDPNLPCFVIGDKIRLHRIALELIGNALNFTDVGHVLVHVSLAKKESQQLVIKLTVTDSGIGIPKEKQQEIYLQFKRLTPSYQGIYKGTGLGLYVVKQFVDELGGEIYVKSEPMKGTCFTCLFPFQAPLLDDDSGIDETDESKMDRPFMQPLPHPLSRTPKPTEQTTPQLMTDVLVVEDNFIAQTVARALLTQLSCKVDIASNGNQALQLCKKNQYDLIFMDIGLGNGIDGYEVTRHIRTMPSDKKHTPIIALTAHGGDESRKRCIESGMDAVLTKPLTQAHAMDVIKTFTHKRRNLPEIKSTKARHDLPDSNDELFQLNQFPILDIEVALKNCGQKNMVNDLLSLMIKDLPTDLAQMHQAYKTHKYDEVEKLAHKIKGGALYLGTTRMKYACQYVERYWKSGQHELFNPLVEQAVNTIDETIKYIEGWLRSDT